MKVVFEKQIVSILHAHMNQSLKMWSEIVNNKRVTCPLKVRLNSGIK